MLDTFYKTHDYLLEHLEVPVQRLLMKEINWQDRLIAIKGSRGIGKTTFLLSYAKDYYGLSRECLYVNFNNFYFSRNTLLEFAGEFVQQGGKLLLLDQTFKYENWASEIRACYDTYPNLHIVFSASPIMRLMEESNPLYGVVKMYNLRGLSFREYLNLQAGQQFPIYTLRDIMLYHEEIAQRIVNRVNPLWYFSDYLHHGYYPFFLEKQNFQEALLKIMNMTLEVDISLVKQIDVTYLPKIRQLLYSFLENTPCQLNVLSLSEQLGMSRATIMNYIKYLKEARLLNMLYMPEKQYPLKPQRVYMQNTNLLYSLPTRQVEPQAVAETFFYNAVHANHKVNATDHNALFVVDGVNYFNVSVHPSVKTSYRMTAVADLKVGTGNKVPLWLFGFLY